MVLGRDGGQRRRVVAELFEIGLSELSEDLWEGATGFFFLIRGAAEGSCDISRAVVRHLLGADDECDVGLANLPLVHRVRFTDDVTRDDNSILLDLVEKSGEHPARVQVWIDSHVDAADPDLMGRISSILQQHPSQIQLTDPPQTIIGGEACKNDPAVIDNLLGHFNDHDLDRRSYVIAIGGGAVLDAVGYAASIAHRGIRLIRIPTTTLAQADSGVGVKNAVNWFGKKNWKGTFAAPWGVINDAAILKTLPDRDFSCGFSEVVKVALLKDPAVFESVGKTADAIRQRDPEASSAAVRASVQMHLDHITAGGDPFESLEARPLDFGHWSAHRLESLTDYSVRHGEAVAIGLAIDCLYAARTLGLPRSDAQRVIDCLQRLGLPTTHSALGDPNPLLDGLEEFRQHLGGRLTLTMIKGIGDPIDIHEVDDVEMRAAIAELAAS